MQVKKIYTYDNNFKELRKKDSSFKLLEEFFDKSNPEYRKNYDENIKTLEVYEFDNLYKLEVSGTYNADNNTIWLDNIKSALLHELLHMSSAKRTEDGIICFNENSLSEFSRVNEGMTEYIKSLISGDDIGTYYLESFVARMLTEINSNALLAYFHANSFEFIKLFSRYNRVDITNIILNTYYCGDDVKIENYDDALEYQRGIRVIFNSLTNLALDYVKESVKLKLYREMFLSHLEDEDIKCLFKENNYKGYHNYAKRLMDKRILRLGE